MLRLLREKQRKVEEATEVSQRSIRKGSTTGMGSASRIMPRRNIQHLENLV